jgi:predicted nucleic acid-binding protein
MKITEKLIKDTYDLIKQRDIEDRPYFQLGSIGHFYWRGDDTYYFRAEEEDFVFGKVALHIITDWNDFLKLHG